MVRCCGGVSERDRGRYDDDDDDAYEKNKKSKKEHGIERFHVDRDRKKLHLVISEYYLPTVPHDCMQSRGAELLLFFGFL